MMILYIRDTKDSTKSTLRDNSFESSDKIQNWHTKPNNLPVHQRPTDCKIKGNNLIHPKYLKTSLTKKIKDLYNGNFMTLKKKFTLKDGKSSHAHGIEVLIFWKDHLTGSVQSSQIKIPVPLISLNYYIWANILKYYIIGLLFFILFAKVLGHCLIYLLILVGFSTHLYVFFRFPIRFFPNFSFY